MISLVQTKLKRSPLLRSHFVADFADCGIINVDILYLLLQERKDWMQTLNVVLIGWSWTVDIAYRENIVCI